MSSLEVNEGGNLQFFEEWVLIKGIRKPSAELVVIQVPKFLVTESLEYKEA